jgi:rhodanese-related sulfurtransferase
MEEVETEKVKEMKENEEAVLVNALPEDAFNSKHIPGSINLPSGSEDFEGMAEKKIPDKEKKVVVYCSGPECHASNKAAEKLEGMGYKEVFHYSGGMKGWADAGYDFEYPE